MSLRILHNPVFHTTKLYVWLDFLSYLFPVSTGQKRISWGRFGEQMWNSSHFVDDMHCHSSAYLPCWLLYLVCDLCDQSPWLLQESFITTSQVASPDTGFHIILQLVSVGSCLIFLSLLPCPSTCPVTIDSRTEHKDNLITETHS